MVRIKCSKCEKKCKGDVLKVGDNYYHKECFVCHVCNESLDNSKFYIANKKLYCQKDILSAKSCTLCGNELKGEVVSALNCSFHRSCFSCSECHQTFNPGDKVSVHKNNYFCKNCIKTSLARDSKSLSRNGSRTKSKQEKQKSQVSSTLKNGKSPSKLYLTKNGKSPSKATSEKKDKSPSKLSLDTVSNGKSNGSTHNTLSKCNGSGTKITHRPASYDPLSTNGSPHTNGSTHTNGTTRNSSRLSIPETELVRTRRNGSHLSPHYNGNYSSRTYSLNYNEHPRDSSIISNGSRSVSKRSTYKPKNFHIPEDRPRYRSMTLGYRETMNGSQTPDTEYSLDHLSVRRAVSPNLSSSTDRYLFNGQRANTIHYYSKPSLASNATVKQKANGHSSTMINDRSQIPILISPMSGSVIVGSTNAVSEETIKLSSFPAARERSVDEKPAVESQDWPGPPEPSVIMAEIMRQKRMTARKEEKAKKNGHVRVNGEQRDTNGHDPYPSKQSSPSKDESQEDLSLDASIDDSLAPPSHNGNSHHAPNHPPPQNGHHHHQFRTMNHWSERLIHECHNGRPMNGDLVSLSRSPDARHEPPVQIRYRTHQYASPSRISYPRQSDRSDRTLNHSMDFVNLGNRHWSADLSQSSNRCHDLQNPKYYSSLVGDGYSNSSYINSILSRLSTTNPKVVIPNGNGQPARQTMNGRNGTQSVIVNGNGLRPQSRGSMFNSSTNSSRLANSLSGFPPLYEEEQVDSTSNERTMESLDDILARSSYPNGPSIPSVFYCSTPSAIFKKPAPIAQKIFPYEQLNLLNKNLPKGIDRTHLEIYLDDREFEKLFKLSRNQFSHLPEWKQNDLKRRVHLF